MTSLEANIPSNVSSHPTVTSATPKSEGDNPGDDQPTPPNADSPTSRTAAREFYLCPELRQHLLSLLDKHTLTRFIRVEKKAVFDVASQLYRSMDYVHVRSRMSVTTARQRHYCDAVVEIDCRGAKLKLAPATLKKTDFVITDTKRRTALTQEYLAEYRTEVFNMVVPPMRNKCRALRKMLFGDPRDPYGSGDSWTVHFEPSEGDMNKEGRRPQRESKDDGGTIDFLRTVKWSLDDEPPAALEIPPPPTEQYTLRYRFDIQIPYSPMNVQRGDRWVTALREATYLGNLHKRASFGCLPMTLDDLSSMYRQQIAAGHADRLETIYARTLPWSLDQFQTFTRLATTSLRLLHIDDYGRDMGDRITFVDLLSLMDTIRDDLPNLTELSLSVAGIETAEMVYEGALGADILVSSGSISELHIHPGIAKPHVKPIPLFNVIRVLSRICTPEAEIQIDGSASSWSIGHDQTEFLGRLWRQTAATRAHLATVDFATLGVFRYPDLYHLGYHEDGRPMQIWEKTIQKANLSEKVRQLRAPGTEIPPLMELEVQRFAKAARRIEAIATTANAEEILMPLRKLRKAIKRAERTLQMKEQLPAGVILMRAVRYLILQMKRSIQPHCREEDSGPEDTLETISPESDAEYEAWE